MTTQQVKAKKLGAVEGALLVLAILLGLLAATLAGNWLGARGYGLWGQLGVWLAAGLCAFFLMRSLIVEYQYTVSGGKFYIERVYGRRSHVMMELSLQDVLFLGDEKEAAQQWPGARVMLSATVSSYAQPRRALAYRQGKQVHLARIQPDEAVGRALAEAGGAAPRTPA